MLGMFLQLFSKNPFWYLTASSLMCNSLSKFHNLKCIFTCCFIQIWNVFSHPVWRP